EAERAQARLPLLGRRLLESSAEEVEQLGAVVEPSMRSGEARVVGPLGPVDAAAQPLPHPVGGDEQGQITAAGLEELGGDIEVVGAQPLAGRTLAPVEI